MIVAAVGVAAACTTIQYLTVNRIRFKIQNTWNTKYKMFELIWTCPHVEGRTVVSASKTATIGKVILPFNYVTIKN